MNVSRQVGNLVLGQVISSVQEASAINKTVCALIAAKGAGQDLVIADDEAFGFMLILEQLGSKLDEAVNNLEKGVAA